MPGPAHSGVCFVETWEPGAGSPGSVQRTEIGGFSTDMILSRIIVDNGSSVSGDGRVTVTIQQAASAAVYNVIENVRNDSFVLDAVNNGLVELGVLVPAGAKLRVEHRHTAGGDNARFTFVWSAI